MITKETFLKDFSVLVKRSFKSHTHEKIVAVNKGEVALMLFISTHENVTPGDLITALDVGSGRVANALKSLENKGYVIRVKDDDDKRKTFVSLTQKGDEYVLKSQQDFIKVMNALYDVLGEDDCENLLRIMEKIVKAREVFNV